MTFTVPESFKEIIAEVVEKVVNEVLEKIEQDYKNIETVFIEAFVAGDIIKNIEEVENNRELILIERYLGMDPINLFNLPTYREELHRYIRDNGLIEQMVNSCELFDPYDIKLQTEDNKRIIIQEVFHRIKHDIIEKALLCYASKNRTRIIKNSRTVLYWAG